MVASFRPIAASSLSPTELNFYAISMQSKSRALVFALGIC